MTRAVVINAEDRFSNDAPPIGVEEGSGFSYNERLFLTWRDGKVLDYDDWHARDIEAMLDKDYKAKQIEQVVAGPLESADYTIAGIKGDNGEADWTTEHFLSDEFSGGPQTPLGLVIAQMTSAVAMRKAYFELVFKITEDSKYGYDKIAFRPASTCRTARDHQGNLIGFEQDPWYLGGVSNVQNMEMIEIPAKRAFIYVHGQRRDPINGVSDLDVPYWCYKTKQKILFLWFQYAEQVALPRTIVTAQDEGTALQVAGQIARLKNSGVMPVSAPGGPGTVSVSSLDSSGKGGEQFKAIIDWLDQAAANSNLAGFTQLTDHEKSGGSWALSSDASDFFLQRLESKSREMGRDIRRGLIAPLIRYNFGPQAKVPTFQFEPLNAEDITPQLELLHQSFLARPGDGAPPPFIEEIAAQVADKWGMDVDKVRKAFQENAARAMKLAEQAGKPPQAQQVAGVAGAVSAADTLTRAAAKADAANGA